MNEQFVVFFSPYAGIWPQAMPEALVAASLRNAGADILYVVCDGFYSAGCTVMSAYRLSGESDPSARERICKQCRKRRDLIVSELGVRTIAIDSLTDSATLAEIESAASTITVENVEHYQVEGFPLGRYALHETIIHYKLTALDEITQPALADIRLKLKHVLMTFYAGKQLLEQFKPDRIVTYNTHVSTNYALMKLCESRDVPVFGLHAGGNMSERMASLYVFRRDMVVLYKGWIQKFEEEWMNLPSTLSGIRNATRHFLALASGKTVWVYSAPKSKKYFDVRDFFGIKPQQKVLLATLSSYDELYSSQMMGVMDTYPLVFPTQVEWMRSVIAYVKNRPDLYLIIRVHPRELPNLRDSVHSRHAKLLAAELTDLPGNIRVNWPSDNISLYDLAPQVDVGLNGWSSTGKELAMLGIPVVIFTKDILYYPATLNILAKDRQDYFCKIDQAISSGWSFECIRQVYRWLAIEYTLGTINIKDGFDYGENARSLWWRVLNRLRRMIIQHAQAKKLRHPLSQATKFANVILEDAPLVPLQLGEQSRLTEVEENRLIRDELKQILLAVYSQIPQGHSATIDNLRRAVSGAMQDDV